MRPSFVTFYKKPGLYATIYTSSLIKSPHVTHIQTDGSYSLHNKPISRTAVILNHPSGKTYRLCKTYFDHANSHEAEWCSVLDGVTYSMKHNLRTIHLENDNLGVMNALINREKPKSPYLEYYHTILELTKELEFLGIRWIPRNLNKADRLFRIS
jgi:ribonuclease HI